MKRRALVAAVAVLVLGGSTGAWYALTPGEYAGVDSIEREPTYQDPALLAEAWSLPVAREYHEEIDFQGNGSFCGPTSMVNVLRSLDREASQGTVLEGSPITSFFGFVIPGITLDQLADLARTRLPDRTIHVERDIDLTRLRALLERANDPAVRMIANFHRGPLFGRGGGHHSPIAGYLERRDRALILDVNRSYGPFLVSPERLFAAIDTRDSVSGRKRGLLVIE